MPVSSVLCVDFSVQDRQRLRIHASWAGYKDGQITYQRRTANLQRSIRIQLQESAHRGDTPRFSSIAVALSHGLHKGPVRRRASIQARSRARTCLRRSPLQTRCPPMKSQQSAFRTSSGGNTLYRVHRCDYGRRIPCRSTLCRSDSEISCPRSSNWPLCRTSTSRRSGGHRGRLFPPIWAVFC